MLLREDDDGVVAIGQASHAWLSGQLARAWGGDRFGSLDPYEEVCLAADQHDVGMAAWDLTPTLDPTTGLPHSFMQMPLRTHLELWSAGPRRLVSQSRYAALLVSMHGWRLYDRRDLERLTPDEAAAVRAFLAEQSTFQRELLVSLRSEPATAAFATPELVARNSQLIWIWDFLSLALCLGWAPCTARDVPTVEEPVDLELTHTAESHRLEPWPFTSDAVKLRCEGRRLSGRSDSDDALQEALKVAPWESVEFELRRQP
jgi:hypothetical protein